MSEFALIDEIRKRCAVARAETVVGNGDDAATLLVPAGYELVVCTDTLVAGRHFPLNTRPQDIGWKALAVNLSDLAAMGAEPAFSLLALTLPEQDLPWLQSFIDGFSELSRQHHVALLGGDMTRGPLSVTVTALGFVPAGHARCRRGAKPGDVIAVCGNLGCAAAALNYLQDHPDCGRSESLDLNLEAHRWVQQLDRPNPQVAQGQVLRDAVSSMIDISDGLAADLGHILAASAVGAEVELAQIPGWVTLSAASDRAMATEQVLHGGDDYVLLVTLSPERFDALRTAVAQSGAQLSKLGRITEGSSITLIDPDGKRESLPTRGWDHFA